MVKTFAFAAALMAITSGSALAQSYSRDYGTGNVSAMEQSLPQAQGWTARAQAVDSRHHAKASSFTNDEKALFGRIRPY